MRNTRVKLDEPSMYRHGLGTLETERSNVNHIVDMINIAMFTNETTPSHVMIGHGVAFNGEQHYVDHIYYMIYIRPFGLRVPRPYMHMLGSSSLT